MSLPLQIVPTIPGKPNYTMRTRFDGKDYNLRFQWNQREERWYFDINTDDSVPLAMGIKIITNRPLLRFYQWDVRLPPGEMMAVDRSLDGSPPGLYDFGPTLRVELVYQPIGIV